MPHLAEHETLRAAVRRGHSGGGVLQHGRIPLVAGNHAIKLFEILDMAHRHTQFLEFEGPSVPDDISVGDGLAMIASETELRIRRRRQFVELVSFGNRDLDFVGIPSRAFKFDGILARLLLFEDVAGFFSKHARANQQQILGGFGIAWEQQTNTCTERGDRAGPDFQSTLW
jgi:hypothetical protein